MVMLICDLSQVNGAADYSADDDNPQKPAETDQGDVNASDTANTSEDWWMMVDHFSA